MASRSTRNKLKHQADKMIDNTERTLQNLMNIDSLADDRSEFITTHLSNMVAYVDELNKLFKHFRSRL